MATNNKKYKQPRKIPVQSQWFKNVGRSLGMTANEMLGELMPSTMEFTASAFETTTEVYNDLKENRVSGKRILNALNMEDQWNMAGQGLKNAIEDIKSGKIYNKDRIDKLYNDGDDFSLEDFDFDDSFSDDDFSDSRVSSDTSPKVKINAPVINDSAPVVASINAQSEVIARAAESTIVASRQVAANSMIFNQRHSQMMVQGMSSINNNLGLLVNFYSDNMSKYIHASINYYETSLGHLQSTVDELKKITLRGEEQAEQKELTNQWDDVLLSYGGLDLKGYFGTVKKNLNTAIDEDLILSSFKSILNDKDTLQYMLASPLSAISTKIVKSVVPTMLQSSLESLDETISNFFPSMLVKISSLGEKHDGNYLWDMVSKVFGINNSNKNGIDVSKYNKGQVPFDGVTKKAITEVIPTYLKKILAAVSGQEEMSYDYDKGTYKKTIDMQKEFTEEQARKARSGYGDVINSVKSRSNAYEFADPSMQSAFKEGIDEFFTRLGKSGKFLNPYKDSEEEFNDIYNFNGDSNFQRLFRAIMKSLDRKDLMALSKGTADSRVALTQYFDQLEKNSALSYQTLLSNGIGIDELIERDSKGVKVGFKSSAFNPVDKYNLSSLDYLRRIENILIEGIRTFPVLDGTGGSGEGNLDRKFSYTERQIKDDRRINSEADKKRDRIKEFTPEDHSKALKKGINLLDSSYDLGEEDEIIDNIRSYMEINTENDTLRDNQRDGLFKKIGKYLPTEESQSKWGNFGDTFNNIITAPGRILSGAVDKLDKTLFSIIFGVSEDGQGYSLVDGMLATFKVKLNDMVTFFNEKVFEPLHETLFGDNGWFTRFKESDMFANMKMKFDGFKDYTFGFKNMEGYRSGGLFADAFNEMKDIFKGFGYYFNGKPYKDSKGNSYPENKSESVFGNIKQIAVDAFDATKQYVFGNGKNGDSKEQDKPITEIIKESLVTGATNFHKAIFGDDDSTLEEHKQIVSDLTGKLKDNMPKTLAWGALGAGAGVLAGTSNLGLLGSMFLPGGPIGGAIVGMGLHLLTQSDTFMDKVFGPKDDNGDRAGGLINASTQKFFSENKNTIIGAGLLGALKPAIGLGWLPSFILPGGPIGGAMMGIAGALTVRSKTFQELMFGRETGDDGKLAGGLLSSFSNKMKGVFGDKSAKEVLGNVGVGAGGGAALSLMVGQMGLLGSMLTPFGPMGGAMLGAATGIALSSDRWRKAIFGDIDEETGKREGGALGKMGNWMEHNVLMPMKDTFDDVKLNVYKWFGESIAFPFREALYPIKTEIHYMVEQTNEMFAKGWGIIQNGISNTLGKFVIKPFGEFMERYVMSPLRKFMGLAFKTSLKALQVSLATPFKLMGMAGGLAERNQERRGKKTYISDLKEARKNGDINVAQYIKQRYFDRDAMNDAKTAAKVGSDYQQQMREEAASNGMTFAQYVNYKKSQARENYYSNLRDKYQSGDMTLSEYLNSRFFDKRAVEREEDRALGTNDRTEYYDKLDADKAKFRDKLNEAEKAREANRSRRKYLRQLGIDSGYTGFIYEKDKDGNTIENGTKVSVDRIIEALSMNKSNMTDAQQDIFRQIGERLGVKNLLDAYGDNGLDMSKLSGRKRRKLQQGISNGNVNDLLRGLNPYTKEERTNAFNEELAELTKEYGERVSSKIDISNKALAELENVFKDAYNLLRAKYGLKTIKFSKNKEGKSTGQQLLLPAPKDLKEDNNEIVNKLDEVIDTLVAVNPATTDLLPMVIDQNDQQPETTELDTSHLTAGAIMEAKNKMFAKEKYEEAEEKKKEIVTANQKFASRKDASFVINENDKKKSIKSFFKNTIMQTDMLTGMNKALSGLAKGMSWAFGKKGVLTGLFLVVLPLILKWLKDRSEGQDHRIDGNGDTIVNTGMGSVLGTSIGKGLGKAAQMLLKSPTASKIASSLAGRYGKWAGGLSEGALKGVGNAAGKATGAASDNVLGSILKASGKSSDDILKLMQPDTIAKLTGNNLDNVTKLIAPEDYIKSIGGGADNLAKGSIDDIARLASQKLIGNSGTTVIDWTKLGANSADEAATGFAKYFKTFKYGKTSSKMNEELAQKLGATGIIDGVQYTVKDELGNIIFESRENGAKKILGWMKTALDDFVTLVLNGLKGVANVTIGTASLTSDIISKVNQRMIMQKFGSLIGNGSKLTLEVLAKTFTDPVMMAYGAVSGAFEAARLFRVYKQDVDITMAAISAAFKGAMNFKYMFLIEMINEVIADITDVDVFSILATNIYKLISDSEKDFALEQAQLDFATGVSMYNDKHGTSLTLDSYNDLVNKYLISDVFNEGSAINHRIDENAAMITNKVLKGGVKALIDGGAEGLSNYVRKGTRLVGKVVDKLPFGKTIRNTVGAAGSLAKVTVKSTVEVLNEIDLGRMNTFRRLVSEAIEKITTTFTKAFPKAGRKFGGTIRKVIISLSDDVLAKFLPNIANKLASKAMGMTAGALTAGVWSGVEFAVGAASGATARGAANLFRVNQEDVDGTMRTIASIVNGLLNVSWFFVIDILNDIYVAMTDTDFLTYLATMMYEVVAGEEKAVELGNDQIAFEAQVKQYNMENGKSLSVDEYNDEVANASWWTKTKNKWKEKKDEKALRAEAKKHGMSVEDYTAYKKSRVNIDKQEIGDVGAITSAVQNLESQKEAIVASTDENMYNLRKLLTATQEGLNTITYEHMVQQYNLTETMSESQLIAIRDAITLFTDQFDNETKEDIAESLGVTSDALDGIVGTVEATVFGLNETTLEKMAPIMNIADENLEGVRWVIEQALGGGLDESIAKKLFEAGEITEEQFTGMTTIIDATLNGMNEETLNALAPILGISEENLGAVKTLIDETMRGINGETEDAMSDLSVADPLAQATKNIEDGMDLVEAETDNWFTNMLETISNWWGNTEAGQALGNFGAWLGEKWNNSGMKEDLDNAGKYMAEDWNNIKIGMSNAGKAIGEGWENTKTTVSANWNNGWNNIKQQGAELGQSISNGASSAGNWILSKLGLKSSDTKTTTNLIEDLTSNNLSVENTKNGGITIDSVRAGINTFANETVPSFMEELTKNWETTKTRITTDWEGFTTSSAELWGSIKSNISETWENTKTTVEEKWSGFVEDTGTKWEEIKTGVYTTWENTKTTVEEKWSGFTEAAGTKWEEIKTGVYTTWENTKTTVEEKWSGFVEDTGTKWQSIKDGISATWENTKAKVEEKLSPAAEEAKEKFTLIKDTMIDKIGGVKDKIREHLGDPLVEGVKKALVKIKEGVLAPFNWLKEKMSGLKTAVSNGISAAASFIDNLFNSGGYGEVELGGKGGDNEDLISPTNLNIIKANATDEFNKQFGTTVNNITNNYNGIPMGGFGENDSQYGPGAKIIPIGGGKPQSVQGVNQSGIGEGGKGTEPDSIHNFAYYAQTDDRYKNHSYDLSPGLGHDSTPQLSARGCGPTSMAMVATQLTGKKYLPTTLADMSRQWGYSVSAGTSWDFYRKAAQAFSMNMGQNSPSVTGMRSAINSGEPIIISGRRTKYNADNSPFTTGGHFVVGVGTEGNSKILINDPRGSKYSKAYDIDKVANEARQIWQFKYNPGGSLPNPDGEYNASNTSNSNTSTVGTSSSDDDLGAWGAFSKMVEAIGLYVGNVTNGTNNQLTWGNSSSSSSSDSSSSGIGSSFIPTTVQDAILKKTLEMTVAAETGGNYTRVKNDTTSSGEPISPSIGIIQMRGNHARTIMQNMYAKLPNSSEAKYWAEWNWDSRAPWSASQRQRLENYLSSNLSVTKRVQDEHAMAYIRDNNLSRVYKYGVDAGKINDPRSIVHLAEIGNTGPAHIKSFLDKYSKGSGGDEFEHYIKQFNSKSYWSNYPIYNNRLNKSYTALKNWDAKQMLDGGKGGDNVSAIYDSLFGGYGEYDVNSMLDNIVKNSKEQSELAISSLMPSCPMDSCGGFGDIKPLSERRGPNEFTADRASKMVNSLMDSVKNRDFSEPTDDNISFDPDLHGIENIGGKGGDPIVDETSTTRDISTTPKDPATEEIKSLNNNVIKMTDKIVAKTPKLVSESTIGKSTISQKSEQSAADSLMLEIISILKGVETNTGSAATNVIKLADKDLSVQVNNDIQIEQGEQGTPVAIVNGGTTNVNPMFNTTTNTKTDVKYVTAKDIARGRINK